MNNSIFSHLCTTYFFKMAITIDRGKTTYARHSLNVFKIDSWTCSNTKKALTTFLFLKYYFQCRFHAQIMPKANRNTSITLIKQYNKF